MIMNTPKVALAFNEVSFAFDDQYSLLLWGKVCELFILQTSNIDFKRLHMHVCINAVHVLIYQIDD